MAVNFTRQSPTWADGHTVYAEDTERWEQLGADVAAWSDLVDGAPDALPQWCLPGMSFFGPGASSETTPADTAVGSPFILHHPRTLDGLAIRVMTAGTGSARLGAVRWNGTTWDTVVDAGTVSIASTGERSVTGIGAALPRGIYQAVVLPQSACTLRTLRGLSSFAGLSSQSGVIFPSDTNVFYRDWRAGVTYGALPATISLSKNLDWEGIHVRTLVRLAA